MKTARFYFYLYNVFQFSCFKSAKFFSFFFALFTGDSCTEKPLNTLWKNYTSNSKPDVQMKLIVTQSGLKAITKEHGLTEYWSHRITYCCAPADLPKIFCWVYRHEGRKLKQELRCHAVLCAKESVARQIANQLQARLTQALIEFKRDKISRQNARLSLANSVYDNPSLPRRKILLSTGSNNYRPPLERSKSAPKLMSIEESLEEEDEYPHADCNSGGSGAAGKKLPKRMDPKMKFATYRNLSYSNRGSRMGGLHGLRCRTPNAFLSMPSFHPVDRNSSQYKEECDGSGLESSGADEVVEQNPLGCKKDCNNLLDLFKKDLVLDERTACDKAPITVVDINENNICETNAAQFFYRKPTWATSTTDDDDGDDDDDDDEAEESYSPCPLYTNTINASDLDDLMRPKYSEHLVRCSTEDCANKCDSLVRSRKRLFENDEKADDERFKKYVAEDTAATATESPLRNLVKNRRKLFECAATTANAGDTASALQFDLTSEDNRDSLECVGSAIDDESATPSLQSISSGSDTSSPPPRDIKLEYSKNCDLDSLWEEDSDESGFVEAIGQDANDDKIRDLPHHQLVKSCILSSKSRCVQV